MTKESRLVQSIAHNARVIEPTLLAEAHYTETLDLSGPRVRLIFDDRYQVIIDGYGLREGDILDVAFSDPFDSDRAAFSESFEIISMGDTPEGSVLVEAVCKEVMKLKRRALTAQAFVQNDPALILEILTETSVIASDFPVVEDYYLSVGEKASKMVRRMSKEVAACCYYNRGSWYIKSFDELLSSPITEQYSANTVQKDAKRIFGASMRHTSKLMDEITAQRYLAFDMEEGVLASGVGPSVMTGCSSQITLSNLSRSLKPELAFYIEAGDFVRMPGDRIEIEWMRNYSSDSLINESLPPTPLIFSITHAQIGDSMSCLVGTRSE